MAIFSKIDKKVLTIIFILLIVILSVGFIFYRCMARPVSNVKNLIGGAQTEIKIQ